MPLTSHLSRFCGEMAGALVKRERLTALNSKVLKSNHTNLTLNVFGRARLLCVGEITVKARMLRIDAASVVVDWRSAVGVSEYLYSSWGRCYAAWIRGNCSRICRPKPGRSSN